MAHNLLDALRDELANVTAKFGETSERAGLIRAAIRDLGGDAPEPKVDKAEAKAPVETRPARVATEKR